MIGRVVGRGVRRALGGLAWALDAAGRMVLYIDVGTRPLSAMRAATRDTWSDLNTDAGSISAGWMPWERRLVSQFVAASDRVLLIGSGTGRDLIPFVEMGCRVTGIEPLPQAVEAAKRALGERQLAATLIEGFAEEATVSSAVTASHLVFGTCTSSRRTNSRRKRSAAVFPSNRPTSTMPTS